MKVACTHCETVAESDVAQSWLTLSNPSGGVDIFCTPGCVVSHMEKVMERAK